MATGTVTRTENAKKSKYGREFTVVQVDWTSTAGGAASDTVSLYGYLIKAITVPGGGGNAPTDNYDITIVDTIGASLDAVGGILIDRDTANTEQVYGIAKNGTDVFPYPPLLCGDYTFTVANAGSAKSGTVYFILDEHP